jgi:hypothetical protein
MSNADDDYKQAFGLGSPLDTIKAKAALELALDIRKFEIGLYWQRAAYFWALIAVAFAGYFAIMGADKLPEKEYLAYIVSCIGLLFTWAWFLVNRGSKYWQENWENHVDMLEDETVGPLYKTILHRPEKKGDILRHPLSPLAISVSKINLLVSIFTLCIWVVLLIHSLPPFRRAAPVSWGHVVVGGSLLFFIIAMPRFAKTDFKPHERVVTKREAKISGTTEKP